MNIFQFSFGDGYAGSSKVALQSSRILMKHGFGVNLFVTKNSLTEKRAIDEGISIYSFNTKVSFNELMKNIFPLFDKLTPKIVISHHSLDRKIGIALKKKYKKNFINIGYRHNISKTIPIIGPFIYNRYYDLLIACSSGVAESLAKSGIKANKIKVIRNSIFIPSSVSNISGKIIRDKYDLNNKIILGMSTWFHRERKGFDILFNAFKDLENKYVLLLIGITENDKQKVIDFASEFGILPEKIIMPGYVDNIWEYYKAMDIFLLTSRSEGFSLALLEAAAARLPIVASNIPGNNEFIVDANNGLLFELSEPMKLKIAIQRLSEDKYFADKLAEKAYQDVMENYQLRNYSDSLFELINQVTKKK